MVTTKSSANVANPSQEAIPPSSAELVSAATVVATAEATAAPQVNTQSSMQSGGMRTLKLMCYLENVDSVGHKCDKINTQALQDLKQQLRERLGLSGTPIDIFTVPDGEKVNIHYAQSLATMSSL